CTLQLIGPYNFNRNEKANRFISCKLFFVHFPNVKEGILLKQTSSFQRWKRRYFKLRGRTLYYAKDCKAREKNFIKTLIWSRSFWKSSCRRTVSPVRTSSLCRGAASRECVSSGGGFLMQKCQTFL
uniref:PH domain-containing protein n=1 Tax=Oryzias latipes TaxID=8090 RepID=A0A3P9ILJ3_ORYLA